MLRLAPEVPKSDSPLLTQALWRRGCGARRHNPLLTRRRATRTGSHRDGRQAASRNAHPFPRHPIMPHANLSDLALLCDSSMTATITSTGWSITASSIYVAIFPIHHHHSSSLALVERRSSPSFLKCENSSRDGRSAKFTELSRTHPQSSRQTHPPSFSTNPLLTRRRSTHAGSQR